MSRDTRGRFLDIWQIETWVVFRVFSIKGDVLLTGRLTPQLIFSSAPLRAPPSELLPFLRPPCSGSRESGVSEPMPVF
jgi:hypothetical protein